jgi:hypothetical protein
MLRKIELSSWSEFEKIIQSELDDETKVLHSGPFFYRGQANSDWHLETTLERHIGPDAAVQSYYHAIKRIQSHIETFTDHNWDLPSNQEFDNAASIMDESIMAYLQYLRHFGYPSPLLDWTLSPYVAAYFAFRDLSRKAESVAIYRFFAASELCGYRPGLPPDADSSPYAIICPIGNAPRRTKRHYLQRSVYTICFRTIKNNLCFASHEHPYIIGSDDESRPGVWIDKYIIPASERITALHSLEAYNINAYSLMGTEESLLESLFLRAYKSREIWKNMYDGNPPEEVNWF